MKLFLIEVLFKNKRRRRYDVDLIVHANSKAAAENLARGK
jgi:hypothetical protein